MDCVVNWPVRCKSLSAILVEFVHIVLVSHADMTSLISRYSISSGIRVLHLYLQLGIWDNGKKGLGIAGQEVRPETSRAPLGHNSNGDWARRSQSSKERRMLCCRIYRICSLLSDPAFWFDCHNLTWIIQLGTCHSRSQQSTAFPNS